MLVHHGGFYGRIAGPRAGCVAALGLHLCALRGRNFLIAQLLQHVQALVNATVQRHQRIVCALLMDATVVEHHNAVRRPYGGQPVSNGNHSDPAPQLGQRHLHDLLGFGVDMRRSLVQKQDARLARQRAGNR